MRFILTMLLVAAFAVAGLTACQNASTSQQNNSSTSTTTSGNTAKTTADKPATATAPKTDEHGHTDDAPRISLADAKKDFDAGNVVFIDTRAEATYKQEHIKGAINIPMEAVEARYKDIPKGKKIIAYCS